MKRLHTRIGSSIALAFALTAAFLSQVADSNAAQFEIIPTNQMWRYIVPTDNAFCLNGTGWETPGFNDSAWAGPAPGGFTGGETTGGTVTSLAGWLNTTTLPAPTALGGRPYYFRTHFNLSSTNALRLYFTNRVDDQAVWYINGVRVFDDAHPNNPETCDPGGSGGGEATTNFVFTLTDAQLGGIVVVGDNVLAVSVHQNATGSSDMVFGTTMWGENVAPDSPITITTSPTSQTVAERSPVTFTVKATGAPLNYYWRSNGVTIVGAPNTASYTIPLTPFSANGAVYSVIVSNSTGPVTSGNATLTVTPDRTSPTLVKAVGELAPDTITLTFSEPIDPNYDPSGFTLFETGTDPDLTPYNVYGVVLTNQTNIVLNTDPRAQGVNYSVRVLDVRDASSGFNIISPNPTILPLRTTIQLIGFDTDNEWKYSTETNLFGTGWETVGYDDSGSTWLSGPAGLGYESDSAGPAPGLNAVPIRTVTAYQTLSSAPQFFRRHFVLPSQTNGVVLQMRYLFEDGAVVYINGQEAGRFNVGSGTLSVTTRSTAGAADPTPISGPVTLPSTNLVPGDNVIAVVVIQSGTASSDCEMALELTGDVGTLLTGPPVITTQPQNVSVNEGQPASLTVVAEGGLPLYYFWRKGGTVLPDKTNSVLSFPAAVPSDAGSYTVIVSNSLGNVTSTAATLTVTPDTTSPSFVSAVGSTNLTNITLTIADNFGLDAASAQNVANYTVHFPAGGGNLVVLSAVLQANGSNVVLTTDPRIQGQNYEVVINGVTDRSVARNPVTPSTRRLNASIIILAPNDTDLWKYNESGADLGTAWQATGYDDTQAGWQSGLAGFSSAPPPAEITPPGFDLRTTTLHAGTNGGPVTTYYRKHFTFPGSTNGAVLTWAGVLDDGAVIYVNGVEAGRLRLTNNPVFYTNLTTAGAPEQGNTNHTVEGPFVLTANNLVASGDNVLAIEVHQDSTNSSDVVMSIQLIAQIQDFSGSQTPTPHISRNASTGQITISWSGGPGCVLQETTQLRTPPGNTVWSPSTAVNGVAFTPTGPMKFYRLACP